MGTVAPVVNATDVSVAYQTKGTTPFMAVEDVSFTVHTGEKFLVIGPSGCGKSTLLMTIAGFIAPTSGRMEVDGEAVRGPGRERAVVFQDFDQLFPWRTVLGNLLFALSVTGQGPTDEKPEDYARRYLRLVGIEQASAKYPHQLSGGMKQRAAIARALAIRPSILLMDEPFGALDAITRTELQQELNTICEQTGVTVVMVTHSIDEAVFLGDCVMVMSANPGTARAVIDTRAVTAFDSPQFDEHVHELRRLLVPAIPGQTPNADPDQGVAR